MHFFLLMFEKSLLTSTTLIPSDLNQKTILTNGNVLGTKNNYSQSKKWQTQFHKSSLKWPR